MRLLAILLLVFGVQGAFCAAPRQGDEAQFRKGLEAALLLTDEGQWSEAEHAWVALVKEHLGADYVRRDLAEIREALMRARFLGSYRTPQAKDVVSGTLQSYSLSTGKVQVLYTPETLGDWERDEDFYLHPMEFRKGYTIEVQGGAKDLSEQQFVFGDFLGTAYVFRLGYNREGDRTYTQHSILQLRNGKFEPMVFKDPEELAKGEANKPVHLKIQVSGSEVKVHLDRKQIMKARLPEEPFGVLAFRPRPLFDRLTIQGTIETAWIDGKIDEATQEAWMAFEADYWDMDLFDAWSSATDTVEARRSIEDLTKSLPFPDKLNEAQGKNLEALQNAAKEATPDSLLKALDKLDDRHLPANTRRTLRMLFLVRADLPDQALAESTVLMGIGEPSLELTLIHVLLLQRDEQFAEAGVLLAALLEEQPNESELRRLLAENRMMEGDYDAALTTVMDGLVISPHSRVLRELRRQVAKAHFGPAWKRSHRESSDVLDLVTDIDPRIARVAVREAEETLAYLQSHFGEAPAWSRRLPIYLFSGEASYLTYIQGAADATADSTLGLYSLKLRQLMLWKQSSRSNLLATLRHELTHAYMHQALGLGPPWIQEGFAEYISECHPEGGEWGPAAPASPTFALYGFWGCGGSPSSSWWAWIKISSWRTRSTPTRCRGPWCTSCSRPHLRTVPSSTRHGRDCRDPAAVSSPCARRWQKLA
ncbi:MAG: tetratricopeptide repeat protein [Planctomycetota bacterium]